MDNNELEAERDNWDEFLLEEDEPEEENGVFDEDDEQLFEDDSFVYWEELWEEAWKIIIHQGAPVRQAEPLEYPRSAWSLGPKYPPFPFNLEETSQCAALVMLILAIHCELDTTWLLRHGYRHYFMRVSSRTFLTVAISFLSTLSFEIIGNLHQQIMTALIHGMSLSIDSWFVEFLGWGPVDDQGHAQEDNGILFHVDTTYLREPIREAVKDIVVLLFQCLVMLLSYVLCYFGSVAVVWLGGCISADLANFMSTNLALPTPGMHGILGLKSLLLEYGIPVFFQVWAAAFLYLSVFLNMSRSETPIILRRDTPDPFSKLAYQLLRATAMHLLAYTAYQVVCICVVAIKGFWLTGNTYDSLIDHPLLLQHTPAIGMLVLGAHWLVKRSCKLFLWLAWPLWIPYIVWFSIKTRISTSQNWNVYWALMGEDMEVLNPDKRVISRAFMTAMFGLQSSWPARMRLSTLRAVD